VEAKAALFGCYLASVGTMEMAARGGRGAAAEHSTASGEGGRRRGALTLGRLPSILLSCLESEM
jgi:hypothetical protein